MNLSCVFCRLVKSILLSSLAAIFLNPLTVVAAKQGSISCYPAPSTCSKTDCPYERPLDDCADACEDAVISEAACCGAGDFADMFCRYAD
ncbi:hypothetical protein BUE80_DR003495 [Diplocarpon rosae]|nr:hypothetical protein BUE80_DR003495 [Diplocarpon rosae]